MKKQHVLLLALIIGLSLTFFLINKKDKPATAEAPTPSEKAAEAQQAASQSPSAKEVVSAESRKPSESSDDELLKYLDKWNPSANWSILKNDLGEITSISGGLIENTSVKEYLTGLAKFLGAKPDMLREMKSKNVKTEFIQTQIFQQYYSGYPVFGSDVAVATRVSDNAIIHVSTTAKHIISANLAQNVDAQQADQKALTAMPMPLRQITAAEGPYVYRPALGEPANLVWFSVVQQKTGKPLQFGVLVSADTGKVQSIFPVTIEN